MGEEKSREWGAKSRSEAIPTRGPKSVTLSSPIMKVQQKSKRSNLREKVPGNIQTSMHRIENEEKKLNLSLNITKSDKLQQKNVQKENILGGKVKLCDKLFVDEWAVMKTGGQESKEKGGGKSATEEPNQIKKWNTFKGGTDSPA